MIKTTTKSQERALQKTPLGGHWKITTILIISTLLYTTLVLIRKLIDRQNFPSFTKKHKTIITILKNYTYIKWNEAPKFKNNKGGKIITITRITSPLNKHQLKILKNERIDNEKCPKWEIKGAQNWKDLSMYYVSFFLIFFSIFLFLNFSKVLRPFLHIIHHPHRGKKKENLSIKDKGCVVLHWHNESINVNPGINFSAQCLLACAHFLAHLHLQKIG